VKPLSEEPTFAAIVGAPRCGTTSLARYLREHPDICFSAVKEPHFFSQHDLSGLDDAQLSAKVERDYLARYFPDAKPGAMLMEGSVTYLYAPRQIATVLRLWPEAKFIIAVRDPFAMLPSLHQRLLLLGDETVTDFAEAWALAPARAQGKYVPRSCVDPRWLQYPEIGKLGKYVEQFFAAVGRERCLVVVLDDLIADPAAIYREALAFLGLADDGRTDFPRHRASLGFKIGWLQRLLKRPPVITRSILAGENFRLRLKAVDKSGPDHWFIRRVLGWHERLLNWNEVPAPAAMLSPTMQEEIRGALSDDVVLLARLLGRDLSHWLGGLPAAGAIESDQPPAISVGA
jgi:sulfotransferase family protein